MFGVTRSGALSIRDLNSPEVRIRDSDLMPISLRASDGQVPLDVRSNARAIAVLETKSAETDPYAVQQAVCQQFHWLFARQILFRRRQMR